MRRLTTYRERRAERYEEERELQRELLAASVPNPTEDDPAQGAGEERRTKDAKCLDELRFVLCRGEEGRACRSIDRWVRGAVVE